MGLSRTNGRFNTFDGEFMLDDEDFSNSKVKFNIDANSVDSNHLGRDNHLRTPTNIPCNWGYVDGFKGPSE